MATLTGKLPEQPPAPSTRIAPAASAPVTWTAVGWFTLLLILAYLPILRPLVAQWMGDEDMGHGFFVPVVAAYIAWRRRDELLALDWKPAWWGLAVMFYAMLQGYIGWLGAELFLQRSAFLIMLVGLLLVLCGKEVVKALAFPLLLLPFMIPIPAVLYNQITFPLQLFASEVAEQVLGLLNIPVLRDGNVLNLASQTLSVAEACSGIRSLLSLTFLALVYSYFFDRRVWMRWALLIGVVPIAILANAGRVTITGILSEKVSPDLAHGFFHSLEGWIIFLIAFVMLLGLHGVISYAARFATRRSAPAEV